jgi:hypothetical protein
METSLTLPFPSLFTISQLDVRDLIWFSGTLFFICLSGHKLILEIFMVDKTKTKKITKNKTPTTLLVKWLEIPEEHDYPAAESYLSLIYDVKIVASFSQQLKASPMASYHAKDIFRASGLSLLGVSNSHVKIDQKKIIAGKPLSPLLLVRDKLNGKVMIADGYHRLCAVYGFDEDALIPCKIV